MIVDSEHDAALWLALAPLNDEDASHYALPGRVVEIEMRNLQQPESALRIALCVTATRQRSSAS